MPSKGFLYTAMLIGALLLDPAVNADTLREKVIAGFVFNFIKFTEWPDLPADAPINLCVAADRETFSILIGFSGKIVIGRRLQVSALETIPLQHCQVLYVSQAHESEEICRRLTSASQLLSISDAPYFAGRCGIIGLYEENRQLRFEINLLNVERSGIRLGSQLLRLARILRENLP